MYGWEIAWRAAGKHGFISQNGYDSKPLALAGAQDYVRTYGVYGEYTITARKSR